MLSRTLSLATVTLLIAGFVAAPARAQNQNLEAGKSPSQIFAGTCTACHKGPRGLLKTVAAGSLQGFLRQHYTTSPEMASLLAGFLVSNGAADTRRVADQPRSGRGEKPETKPGGAPDQPSRFGRRLRTEPPQDAAKFESEPRDGSKPHLDGMAEPGHQARSAKRSVRPEEPGAAEGQTPAQLSNERGTTKQKLGKRAKPGSEESPKTEAAKTDSAKEEPAKTETDQGDTPKSETASEATKPESAKSEGDKPEGKADSGQAEGTKIEAAKPSADSGKSESEGIETPSETGKPQMPASGSEPVTSVTPAPAPSTGSVPVTSATTDPPAAPAVAQPAQSPPPSQALATSAPAAVAPAGPPVPPISR
jgi:hypothetical protein